MQAVILAGGLGTRLKPYTDKHPKPMIKVEGKPFLEHLLLQIAGWGIQDVVLLLGYKAEEIQEYFGRGEKWGLKIEYIVTPTEYDTGARIKAAFSVMQDEFFLLYCDNYCPIDYEYAYKRFKDEENDIQLTAYANRDGYTKNNLREFNGIIVEYDKKRLSENLSAVDIGYAFVRKDAVNRLPDNNCNFEDIIYPEIIQNNKMGCYITEHRYYSIGSWERMELTKEFFKAKKVVFLDRDGTMNVRPPKACYIQSKEDFVWLPKARDAIKLLKDSNYEVYVITNQPGIARGYLSEEALVEIHNKMRADLNKIGADIDGIYVCPHGWDDGCFCRKPKPGMLYQAQKEHSLNLTECILIGDDERDIEAGVAAGLKKEYLLSDDYSLWDAVQEVLSNK